MELKRVTIGAVCIAACLLTISAVADSSLLRFRRCAQINNANRDGHCVKAMDGNANQRWGGKSITHTKKGNHNWWTGFFDREVQIRSVKIYNRMDCCQSRLNHFVILVDGKRCASYSSSRPLSIKSFPCHARGSSVTILSTQRGSYLSLAEVRVYGSRISLGSALHFRRCAQINNQFSRAGHCGKAMDGNPNYSWGAHSITHTKKGNRNWWTGYFSGNMLVTYVRIYNRLDCCPARLRRFVIKVDGKTCARFSSAQWFPVRSFRCNAVGKSVTVQSTQKGSYLSLAEVQVFGRPHSGSAVSGKCSEADKVCYRYEKCYEYQSCHGDGSNCRGVKTKCTHVVKCQCPSG